VVFVAKRYSNQETLDTFGVPDSWRLVTSSGRFQFEPIINLQVSRAVAGSSCPQNIRGPNVSIGD
jgi:hypothetical protein